MDALWLYAGQLLQGTWITLQLALCAVALGLLMGLALAIGSLSPLLPLRRALMLGTALLRGVPEFLLVLVCYFGLSNLFAEDAAGGWSISAFGAGVIALSLVFAAYAAEVLRGALAAIPPGQLEAARALGLRPVQVFVSIQLPLAWRIALPSLGNLWQSLLKDTSLVSVVGLEDLLKKANIAGQATHQPFLFFMAAAVVYFGLLRLSQPVFSRLERRAAQGFSAQPT